MLPAPTRASSSIEAVTGLTRKPSSKACSAGARWLSISRPCAVTITTTGIWRPRASARICWLVAQPSRPGINQSTNTAWQLMPAACCCCSSASAAGPLSATSTTQPSDWPMRCSTSRAVGLSSTTRARSDGVAVAVLTDTGDTGDAGARARSI